MVLSNVSSSIDLCGSVNSGLFWVVIEWSRCGEVIIIVISISVEQIRVYVSVFSCCDSSVVISVDLVKLLMLNSVWKLDISGCFVVCLIFMV